jgi:hypothetical protein
MGTSTVILLASHPYNVLTLIFDSTYVSDIFRLLFISSSWKLPFKYSFLSSWNLPSFMPCIVHTVSIDEVLIL